MRFEFGVVPDVRYSVQQWQPTTGWKIVTDWAKTRDEVVSVLAALKRQGGICKLVKRTTFYEPEKEVDTVQEEKLAAAEAENERLRAKLEAYQKKRRGVDTDGRETGAGD